ncbi:PucR family transcriptional regulator [Lentzea sp. NPDC058450]|uniref:PucR family transcriptional regulator n=1 Tax=Lentzea sp. NPDC058450 TaxID=3346505 RepID=UPI00365A0170
MSNQTAILRQPLHARLRQHTARFATLCTEDIVAALTPYAALPPAAIEHLRTETALIINGVLDQVAGGELFPATELRAQLVATGALRARQGIPFAAIDSTVDISWMTCMREVLAATEARDQQSLTRLMAAAQGSLPLIRSVSMSGFYAESVNLRGTATLAQALISDSIDLPEVSRTTGIRLWETYCVLVVRDTGRTSPPRLGENGGELLLTHEEDRIVLLSGARAVPADRDRLPENLLECWHRIRHACPAATGGWAWAGSPQEVAEAYRMAAGTAALASPASSQPLRLDDAVVDLALCRDPELRQAVRRQTLALDPHPELLATLETFYALDMDRGRVAHVLHVHRNTLDYRLRRVRELTGINPVGVHGIRTLTAALAARRVTG